MRWTNTLDPPRTIPNQWAVFICGSPYPRMLIQSSYCLPLWPRASKSTPGPSGPLIKVPLKTKCGFALAIQHMQASQKASKNWPPFVTKNLASPSPAAIPIINRRFKTRKTSKMKEITLKNRPQGSPTHDDFSLVEWQKPTLNAGEILVAVHSFSLDPYMRGRMDDAKSYAAPVSLGARMEAGGVGQVIESASDHFEIGDFVFGMTGWATHAVLNAKLVRKLDLPREHLTRALGVLGMPGFTGWYGLITHGRPKAGETL